MDTKDFGHSQSSKPESGVFLGGRERRTLPLACSPRRQRRTRDRESHVLSSELGTLLARTHPAGAKRNATFARNHYRPRDHVVPATLRSRHGTNATERAE